mmetsp:Transcript_90524/g.251660  ORF Transcript_90524/g.251660 Transcript_90524/m.251660 type:complete len:211 (+) Transcript_90524:77-709(+)
MEFTSADEIRIRSLAALARSLAGAPSEQPPACSSRCRPSDTSTNCWELVWNEVHIALVARRLEAAICEAVQTIGGRTAGITQTRCDYKSKIRLLIATFRRSECAALREQVIGGGVRVEELARWPPEALLAPERRASLERERRESLRATVLVGHAFGLFSDLLECPKCAKRGANYALPTFTGHWAMKHETGKAVLAQCPACLYQWQQQEGF